MSAGTPSLERLWLVPLLRSIALGGLLGGAAVIAARLGPELPLLRELTRVSGAGARLAEGLNASVGPVWIPMLLVGLRVGWLAGRALRTRHGHGRPVAPVRPELGQLAPLFAALGLCGTVWGLSAAFDALGGGEFLSRLPVLLGGLGAAMSSTLLGLGLQIATLLIAAFNPAWSLAVVDTRGGSISFSLDTRALGAGEAGLKAMVLAVEARQPEALRVELASGVAEEWRVRIHDTLWRSLDSAIPIREISG
jgi:hypothetical protein